MTAESDPQLKTSTEGRKLVTVLFADLEDSTGLGETLDIESLRALLTDYFETMSQVVVALGGSVEKYIGDAVVAVFGVPTTHEDDAARAVRAASDMHRRLSETNPVLKERYGVELAMRIGINTGEVLTSEDAHAMLAGDVFNVAARLEGHAQPGTTVVGQRTRDSASTWFAFEPLGEIDLKGKTEPQAVWTAGEPRGSERQSIETVMVGREAELAMIEALMDQAISGGRPKLVVLLGEAGIGKSRLAAEFLNGVSEKVRTLVGRCLPYGEGITFWPLREVLWEAAGITLDDDSEEAGSKLAEMVAELPPASVPDGGWLVNTLAVTAGIALEDNPIDSLSPQSAGEELQLAWPTLASALAAEEPTVLLFEDVHWAETPLLDMLEQLALRAVGPLMIVATARPVFLEQQAGWGARALPSQISLGPLTDDSFGQLTEQLLPGASDDVRRRLRASAGGNPFFAEELARHSMEEDLTGIKVGPGSVPDSARSLLAARIDQLAPVDREVLQDAAVIGDVFWPAPLERIRGANVSASIATLERGGFVVTRPVTSLPGQHEMTFRHGLMCDVAYQSIPRRRLAATHAAVADWTEELASDRRDEFIEVIAHHYGAAAQPDVARLAWMDDPKRGEEVRSKALETLVEAGRAARRRFSIEQAVGYADRALALAATDEERLSPLLLKAASLHAAARVDEAWPVYVDAITAARQAGDEEMTSAAITEATLLWSRYGGAFSNEDWKPEAVKEVQRRLDEIGEDEETLELAALLTGRSVWGRRKLLARSSQEVKADAERAIAISERLGSEKLLSHALDAFGMCLREEGFCELGELADRMINLGSTMVDRRQAHEMLVTAAISLTEIGRYEDSREVGAIVAADAASMGVHQHIHGIRASTGYLVPNGQFAEILDGSEDLLRLIRDDSGLVCDFGGGAVIGRTLALFERGLREEAYEALQFFQSALPDIKRIPIVELQMVERVRPFIDAEHALNLLEDASDLSAPAHHIYWIRARLPLAVALGDWHEVDLLTQKAEELAISSCAPLVGSIAAWATAVREGSVDRTRTALSGVNEPYTAARLAVDFFSMAPEAQDGQFRKATEMVLSDMGALASLDHLQAASGGGHQSQDVGPHP